METDTPKVEHSELLDFALILNRQSDFDEILRLVAHKTADILRAESVMIMMFNPNTQKTIKTVLRKGKRVQSRRLDSVESQITGWMQYNRQSLISSDIKMDPRFVNLNISELSVQSTIAALLRVENLIFGSIIVFRKDDAESFDEEDLSILDYIAAIAAPYLRNLEKISDYFAPNIGKNALQEKYAQVGLIGASKKFIELLHAIEAAARCDVRVVLEGESGTGKELIAKAIHQFSTRRDKSFVPLDCGAIPQHLIESELFGYKKGAFTGANKDRKGLVEEANGGTLFMDEINNLPFDLQAKFMRFLQEGEIRPIGSNIPINVNVRIISASSQVLNKLVEKGQFRQDLFFRLHVYPLYVPSLGDRGKDIVLLGKHFLAHFSKQQHKRIESFHSDIIQFMRRRPWKGNIRELENFVERMVTITPNTTESISLDLLPADLQAEYRKIAKDDTFFVEQRPLAESIAEFEENVIRKTLVENNWNQSKSARILNISEHTLRHKMQKLKIVRPV